MKIADIRKLSTEQLTKDSTSLREEIAELRRSIHMGETQNVRVIRNKRKDLARMLTVLSDQLAKGEHVMAKTLVGVVSSDKGDKTIVVTVSTKKTHPLYNKQYTEDRKFMAHDEKNEAHSGDRVSIIETRPLSARKRFKLKKVIERAGVEHTELEVEKA